MAKNTKQIALIQNRHGKVNELPKQLSTGEFGFADDTNQLFIGNGDHPTLKERLNSNTFPYGNVEIVTEFSDIPEIAKYSPKMNGIKVNYPITLMGNKTLPTVENGSSIIINDKEVVFEDLVIKDYDYLVLKYIWTDGKDLDTDTRFINLNNFPEINDKGIGYHDTTYNDGHYGDAGYILPIGSSIPQSYLHSVGDNTHDASIENPQEENILISRNNIINDANYDLLPNDIKIELSGTWYASVGHNTVKIEICAYKGGVMDYNQSTYKYYNTGGEEVIFGYDDQGNPIKTLSIDVTNLSDVLHEYRLLGYITIDKETGSTIISTDIADNNDQNTVKIENPLDKIIYTINNVVNDVEAIKVNDKICLKTFKEILTLEDGIDINGINTLEALGFSEGVILADKLTKRSVQDVLDDRYSIKAFDVMGDGFTDDSEGINLATDIVYGFNKSDKKELYFPADTYAINDNSINLLSNTHFVGEGIDRTIIKSGSNLQSLLVTVDDNLRKPNESDYCINLPGQEKEYNARFKFKDNFYNTYGKIKNVIFTCIRYNSEEFGPNDWQYIASVHFEKGVLPISIKKDNSEIIYHKESFEYYSENSEATTYNSATPVDYINCIGRDMPNQMVWSRHSKEKANKDYTVARKYGWNFGYNEGTPTISVDPQRYVAEINNSGTELLIKNGTGDIIVALYDELVSYMDYPHNILIENMTFDASSSSSSEIIKLGHSNDITFKDCKFICKNVGDILNTQNDSKLKDIKFINCIFEGNDSTRSQIIINGQLDGLLITNCEFNNIKNSVVVLNANDEKIKNGIIANNKFNNCGADNIPLISVNENTEYVNVVKSMVEYPYLTNEREVLNRWDGDYNYCDTPNMLNDHNKYVRCTFYQDIYDYVQALYTKYGKNALEVVSPDRNIETTNYIKMITGTDENDNTVSLSATNQMGNVEFNMGKYGDLLVGKDSNIIEEWKQRYPYNLLDVMKINQTLYRCIEKHTSLTYFEPDKWVEIFDTEILLWRPDILYNINDFVIYEDNVYRCNVSHTSIFTFTPQYWELITDVDSAIVLYKNLDVNDSIIENRTDNDIIFRADSNALIVDDSRSEVPYKDRIGDKDNALATVGFINNAINSYVNERYDVDTINQKVGEEKSSEILLYDFDSTKYGREVYLRDASINVRQLFIPVAEQLQAVYPDQCEYLPWANKISYNTPNSYKAETADTPADIIEILNPNDNLYEYYKCIVDHQCTISYPTEWENFTNELNRGYWQRLTDNISNYEGYSSKAFDHVTWYKGDIVRFIRFDEESTVDGSTQNPYFPQSWGRLLELMISVIPNKNNNGYAYAWNLRFENNYILPVYVDKTTLNPEFNFNWVVQTERFDLNSAYYDSTQQKLILAIAEYTENGIKWKDISNHNLVEISNSTAVSWNWDENHLVDGKAQYTTLRFSYTLSNCLLKVYDTYNPDTYLLGTWEYYVPQTEGRIYFYSCKKDHQSSVFWNEEDSIDNDIAKGCWEEIIIDATKLIRVFDDEGYTYNIDEAGSISYTGNFIHLTRYIGGKVYVMLPELKDVINSVPDLKYISLKLVDKLGRNVDKWLFPIDDVDLIYRNTNGYTYPLWRANTTYQNGDMVRFNYSNFKCIAENNGYPSSYTSGHDHLDLHNAKYWKKLNESGYDYRYHFERDFLIKNSDGEFQLEDYQYTHNVSDHKLYICFYDEKGNNIEILNYDMTKYFQYNYWEPYSTYYVGDYIINGDTNILYTVREDFSSGQTFATEVDFGQVEWTPRTQYFGPDATLQTKQYVKHEDKLYMVQFDFVSGDTFETVVDGRTVLSEVLSPWKLLSEVNDTDWNPLTKYFKGQYIRHNSEVYQVLEDYTSSSEFITDYKAKYFKLIPTQHMQLGRSGELLIKVNYTKGNE